MILRSCPGTASALGRFGSYDEQASSWHEGSTSQNRACVINLYCILCSRPISLEEAQLWTKA